MILGTAGFTAALALLRMTENRQAPELGRSRSPARLVASVRWRSRSPARPASRCTRDQRQAEHAGYLKSLGASEVLGRDALAHQRPDGIRALRRRLDNVGGAMLASLLAQTAPYGNVASAGLAASPELHATVMPFIIRGVSLAWPRPAPRDIREEVWRLAGDGNPPASRRSAPTEPASTACRKCSRPCSPAVRSDARWSPSAAATILAPRAAATTDQRTGNYPMARILIVDDSPSQVMGIRASSKSSATPITAEGRRGRGGSRQARIAGPDPDGRGDAEPQRLPGHALDHPRSHHPAIPVILVTTQGPGHRPRLGHAPGAKAYPRQTLRRGTRLAELIAKYLVPGGPAAGLAASGSCTPPIVAEGVAQAAWPGPGLAVRLRRQHFQVIPRSGRPASRRAARVRAGAACARLPNPAARAVPPNCPASARSRSRPGRFPRRHRQAVEDVAAVDLELDCAAYSISSNRSPPLPPCPPSRIACPGGCLGHAHVQRLAVDADAHAVAARPPPAAPRAGRGLSNAVVGRARPAGGSRRGRTSIRRNR